MNGLSFYTLLHIRTSDPDIRLAENSKSKFTGYIKCCEALDKSLKPYGHSLIVLTNNMEVLKAYSNSLEFCNISFGLEVPNDINFYSAHFKLDVYKYLSNIKGYSILLDCDIICINKMPLAMENLISNNIPMYYDITDQCYPAYGREKLIEDKSIIMEKKSLGNWGGGEFISGNAAFFGKLYELCMGYWDIYMKTYKTLHHNGDEMLTSCAIEEYYIQNNPIFNIGTIGGISRYWSSSTLHVQKRYEAVLDNFLLHLPADKEFIAKHSNKKVEKIMSSYKKYLLVRKVLIKTLRPIKVLASKIAVR